MKKFLKSVILLTLCFIFLLSTQVFAEAPQLPINPSGDLYINDELLSAKYYRSKIDENLCVVPLREVAEYFSMEIIQNPDKSVTVNSLADNTTSATFVTGSEVVNYTKRYSENYTYTLISPVELINNKLYISFYEFAKIFSIPLSSHFYFDYDGSFKIYTTDYLEQNEDKFSNELNLESAENDIKYVTYMLSSEYFINLGNYIRSLDEVQQLKPKFTESDAYKYAIENLILSEEFINMVTTAEKVPSYTIFMKEMKELDSYKRLCKEMGYTDLPNIKTLNSVELSQLIDKALESPILFNFISDTVSLVSFENFAMDFYLNEELAKSSKAFYDLSYKLENEGHLYSTNIYDENSELLNLARYKIYNSEEFIKYRTYVNYLYHYPYNNASELEIAEYTEAAKLVFNIFSSDESVAYFKYFFTSNEFQEFYSTVKNSDSLKYTLDLLFYNESFDDVLAKIQEFESYNKLLIDLAMLDSYKKICNETGYSNIYIELKESTPDELPAILDKLFNSPSFAEFLADVIKLKSFDSFIEELVPYLNSYPLEIHFYIKHIAPVTVVSDENTELYKALEKLIEAIIETNEFQNFTSYIEKAYSI